MKVIKFNYYNYLNYSVLSGICGAKGMHFFYMERDGGFDPEGVRKSEQLYWFAMSVPYNRVMKVKTMLDNLHIECFVPMRYEVRTVKGRKTRLCVPAISNLLFVHTTDSILKMFKQTTTFLQYLVCRVDGVSRKIIVPDAQMQQFIRISLTYDEELVYLKPEEVNLTKGTRVRILGGAFDGVEGVFLKIKGKRSRRVVVLIDNVSAVAVSEVSPDLIEVLDS